MGKLLEIRKDDDKQTLTFVFSDGQHKEPKVFTNDLKFEAINARARVRNEIRSRRIRKVERLPEFAAADIECRARCMANFDARRYWLTDEERETITRAWIDALAPFIGYIAR